MSREFIALAIMGIDQHENGVVAVARVLREAQMKVEHFGKFQTPDSVADRAIREGADVIGISCHSWEYIRLVPQLICAYRPGQLDWFREPGDRRGRIGADA
jgi:methylmalonyl-CoA mutase cobalamin-binding domain/chain